MAKEAELCTLVNLHIIRNADKPIRVHIRRIIAAFLKEYKSSLTSGAEEFTLHRPLISYRIKRSTLVETLRHIIKNAEEIEMLNWKNSRRMPLISKKYRESKNAPLERQYAPVLKLAAAMALKHLQSSPEKKERKEERQLRFNF